MTYNVGDKVKFKLIAGRGRPMTGEIIKNLGIAFMVKPRIGDNVRVPKSKILGIHTGEYKKSA